MSSMPPIFRAVLMLCAGILPVAAEFVPPTEGPPPFRRDQLPLDADTMGSLSRQLTVLAGDPPAGVSAEGVLRSAAQALALALALDPENEDAKQGIDLLRRGDSLKRSGPDEIGRVRNRAWQILAWLEMPEAGEDGQALAACLGDVLAAADPRHPKSEQWRKAGEKGAWTNWVAAESEFRDKEPSPIEEEEVEMPVAEEEEEAPREPSKDLAVNELSVKMPIWQYDKIAQKMALDIATVNLRASVSQVPEEEEGKPTFQMVGDGFDPRLADSFHRVEQFVGSRHGSLPRGLSVQIGMAKGGYTFSRNGRTLSGAAALLMDGAMTGKRPTAMPLVVVGEGGKLELPPRFWQTLRALSPLEGGRLILPDAAADYLTALVVLDDAAFFMKYEVLLAGSVDELCDLASPNPDPEVADGLKRFDEIRKVGQGKPLGTFVAHPTTQQRLREVVGLLPEHASARLLALQGSGSRPRFLQRAILAREIRTAVEPMAYLTDRNPQMRDSDRLEAVRKSCREMLDRLTGYIDIRDRDLHKAAVDVTDSLRTLARLLAKRDSDNPGNLMMKQTEALNAAYQGYHQLLRDLSAAAGDVEDFPLPAARDQN